MACAAASNHPTIGTVHVDSHTENLDIDALSIDALSQHLDDALLQTCLHAPALPDTHYSPSMFLAADERAGTSTLCSCFTSTKVLHVPALLVQKYYTY
jgi:hypothetical protein